MQTLVEMPPTFGALDAEARRIAAELAAAVPVLASGHVLEAGRDFTVPADRLYCLREGTVGAELSGRTAFFLTEGDIVDGPGGWAAPEVRLRTDFAVIVDAFGADQWRRTVAGSELLAGKWAEYQRLRSRQLLLLIAHLVPADAAVVPIMRRFSAGDVIIEQGSEGREVYSLLEGRAQVLVDGVTVGEVGPDEIFGAMAALIGTARTARVVAVEDSLTAVLPPEEFDQLMQTRPGMVLRLLQDMARTIAALNRRVAGL